MEYVLLILGFAMLIKGADFFVEGSSSIAKKLRIPPLIIGLTIVAFGTSAPEAAVSVTAALNNSNELALANVIGSNIFNILAVIGFAAIIKPMKVQKSIIKKEYPFAMLSYALLFVLAFDIFITSTAQDDILSRSDGIVLLLVFSIYIYSLLMFALSSKEQDTGEEIKTIPTWRSVVFTIGGMGLIIAGGQLVVMNATTIAASWGMSENLIGLTIVAVGTSLPELVTSIVAAKKGENDIALGNVIGSNIFNIFFVLGLASVISPVPVSALAFTDILIMSAVSLVVYVFAITQRKINRGEGIVLLVLFFAYNTYIILR